MLESGTQFPHFSSWTSKQLVAWVKGLAPKCRAHLDMLKKANVDGRWLIHLTASDLTDLGIFEPVFLRVVENLSEQYATLETDTLQDIIFRLLRSIALISSVLSRINRINRLPENGKRSDLDDLVHTLSALSTRLEKDTALAISWLQRIPFSWMSCVSTLEPLISTDGEKLKANIHLCLNSSLGDYVEPALELVNQLRERLENFIQNCDDSLLLTPCSIEIVNLGKFEPTDFGFSFITTETGVHVIRSVRPDLITFGSGRLAKDDEIVEVNGQVVLLWEHEAVEEAILQTPRRLTLRIRKRPSHCTDFIGSGRRTRGLSNQQHNHRYQQQHGQQQNSHQERQQHRLRPLARSPPSAGTHQQARRSHLLLGRVPKRRAQPTTEPNTLDNESQPITADAKGDTPPSSLPSPMCNNGGTGSQVHCRPRGERFFQSLHSPSAIAEANEDQLPNETDSREPSEQPVTGETSNSTPRTTSGDLSSWWSAFESTANVHTSLLLPDQPSPCQSSDPDASVSSQQSTDKRKTRRRPATLGSLDDFTQQEAFNWKNATQRISCKALGLGDCQGWLWLKKRSSFANKYVKRWCVFKHNTLYYYRHPDDDYAEGLIILNGVTISPTSDARSGRYAFRIYNDWANFVFAANSEQSRTKWMNMLGLAAIGLSASVRTARIGGFHPGYLVRSATASPLPNRRSTALSDSSVLPPSPSPRLLDLPRPQTAGAVVKQTPNEQYVSGVGVAHRSTSGLAVPPTDNSCAHLSASATCLGSSDAEGEDAFAFPATTEDDRVHLPFRFTRRAAMIRRQGRRRRLTDGSISPSVYLTPAPYEWTTASTEVLQSLSGGPDGGGDDDDDEVDGGVGVAATSIFAPPTHRHSTPDGVLITAPPTINSAGHYSASLEGPLLVASTTDSDASVSKSSARASSS
ncbi:hypothetical protein AAHC03_016611 [Spirometra sp. Aus1]